ncbi:Ptk1p [Saccharomyces cerevisiae x Saccharomyces kudriavzevii VIN7]|uniref:non-specific serine/threonine protein kinase n=1 Tax=Saccharomyces cerevisiae x Saccharomyces kudriavzevii (strain VIN7) TaxID=1095631 RepID=H0GX98_SACCK|nr:Ptk1p [Saccharomyces cerevisiae x Saccharomyces kudriavzevii VIN7]
MTVSNNHSTKISQQSISSMSALKFFGKKLLSSKHDNKLKKKASLPPDFHSTTAHSSGSPSGSKLATPLKATRRANSFVHSTNNNSSSSPGSAKNLRTGCTSTSSSRANRHSSTSRNASGSKLSNERMVYNPYGVSTPNTSLSSISTTAKKDPDLGFYLHDGGSNIRMLPIPIVDPNEYLPDEMKEASIQLSDNFVFDDENKTIGWGGSCEVRKIRSKYRKKDVFALKKLNMIYNETPEKFYKRCSKEFIIAKQLSHHVHITNTFLLVKVPTTVYTTRGWGFIMELGLRDLFAMIQKSGWRNVALAEKFCIFKQVAHGVKFCHDQGIAHRDLKPENVLLSPEGVCKLTDFGISDWYRTDPLDLSSPAKTCAGMIGSPPYAPPEVMYYDAKKHYDAELQQPYDPRALDCYGLGVILMTLVNNIIPFLESCSFDVGFRDYCDAYENFIRLHNRGFRDPGNHRPGPGMEYHLARNFKNGHAARVAWRLADPEAATRYTMDDLFEDPWFQSIETCVNAGDEYVCKNPAVKNTTYENLRGFHIATDVAAVAPTSNPFLKARVPIRSMIDIAAHPSPAPTPTATALPPPPAHSCASGEALFTLTETPPPQLGKLTLDDEAPATAAASARAAPGPHRAVVHHHLNITGSLVSSSSAAPSQIPAST